MHSVRFSFRSFFMINSVPGHRPFHLQHDLQSRYAHISP
nr:MAG TPA: hypothetical protein [Caudoviricetes sp.]